jgi:hypothetical protein
MTPAICLAPTKARQPFSLRRQATFALHVANPFWMRLNPDEQKELESRVAEDETSPADVTTWDEIKSDALKRWRP